MCQETFSNDNTYLNTGENFRRKKKKVLAEKERKRKINPSFVIYVDSELRRRHFIFLIAREFSSLPAPASTAASAAALLRLFPGLFSLFHLFFILFYSLLQGYNYNIEDKCLQQEILPETAKPAPKRRREWIYLEDRNVKWSYFRNFKLNSENIRVQHEEEKIYNNDEGKIGRTDLMEKFRATKKRKEKENEVIGF